LGEGRGLLLRLYSMKAEPSRKLSIVFADVRSVLLECVIYTSAVLVSFISWLKEPVVKLLLTAYVRSVFLQSVV
jgi:hypothetical protein